MKANRLCVTEFKTVHFFPKEEDKFKLLYVSIYPEYFH